VKLTALTNPLSDQLKVNPFSRFGIGFLISPLSAYTLLWEHLMQVVESLESGPNKSLNKYKNITSYFQVEHLDI